MLGFTSFTSMLDRVAETYSDTIRLLKLLYTYFTNIASADLLKLTQHLIQELTIRHGSVKGYKHKISIIRHKHGPLFIVRVGTYSDLYNIAREEQYELERWFLPLVQGTFIDVGAYIGKYTVFACRSGKVDRLIAIEPIPLNFVVLRANVKLNLCEEKAILINRAVDSVSGSKYIYVPVTMHGASLSRASLTKYGSERYIKLQVQVEPLDMIIQRLGVEYINFLKIDIEGYVLKALPGLVETLKRTKYLMIELLGREISAHRTLKQLGFKLLDRHGHNYLYIRGT